MLIYFRTLDGKMYSLEVEKWYSVESLLSMLKDRIGPCSCSDYRVLLYGGRKLNGSDTLADCNIMDSSTLHVVTILSGA
jgi:hypothetical protein